jgi:hypothetical protein
MQVGSRKMEDGRWKMVEAKTEESPEAAVQDNQMNRLITTRKSYIQRIALWSHIGAIALEKWMTVTDLLHRNLTIIEYE